MTRFHQHFLFKAIECPGFPGGLVIKNPPAKAGNVGSIPGSGRSHGEGNDNLLQRSCLGNPMDRGAWQVTVHGVTKELETTTKHIIDPHFTHPVYHSQSPAEASFL